ncbi:MAG TPA: hypothetical protein VF719_09580, partial [Abditibacteriaceae bacterium]
LIVGDQTIRLAEPLSTPQWIWAAFPLIMIILGGALGGLLGAVATTINAQIFRSERSTVSKYLISGVVSIVAFAAWIFVLTLLRRS